MFVQGQSAQRHHFPSFSIGLMFLSDLLGSNQHVFTNLETPATSSTSIWIIMI